MRVDTKKFNFQCVKGHLEMLMDFRFQQIISDENYNNLNELIENICSNEEIII